MPKKSVINMETFRAEAHLGVKHLMARFGVQRVTVNNYARSNGIKVARKFGAQVGVMKWRRDGRYEGFSSGAESLRAFLDRTGVNNTAGRADDEIVLAAIRLRRKGMKPQQIGQILGISRDKLLSVYQQSQAVRAADVRASGEPFGKIMKEYW